MKCIFYAIPLVLSGCGQQPTYLLARDVDDYGMCIARAGGVNLLGIEAAFENACRKVEAPSVTCASALENVASLHADVTIVAINTARDACEGPRQVGPAYTPPAIALDLEEGETEADWWDTAEGENLKNESSKRQRDRTAFTRANLGAINRCFSSGDFMSCTSVHRAAENAPVDVEAYGYLCTILTGYIAERQAVHNQPGAITTTPNNVGASAEDLFFLADPKWLGNTAYECNLELRKSGIPPLHSESR